MTVTLRDSPAPAVDPRQRAVIAHKSATSVAAALPYRSPMPARTRSAPILLPEWDTFIAGTRSTLRAGLVTRGFVGVSDGIRTHDIQDHNLAL